MVEWLSEGGKKNNFDPIVKLMENNGFGKDYFEAVIVYIQRDLIVFFFKIEFYTLLYLQCK